MEVISLVFQVDVSVLTIDKAKLKTFQVIFCVTSYFCFKSCNCKQANFFIFNSECRAALGTSGSFEQGSLLHQVSVVPLSSGLFVYSVCLVYYLLLKLLSALGISHVSVTVRFEKIFEWVSACINLTVTNQC